MCSVRDGEFGGAARHGLRYVDGGTKSEGVAEHRPGTPGMILQI